MSDEALKDQRERGIEQEYRQLRNEVQVFLGDCEDTKQVLKHILRKKTYVGGDLSSKLILEYYRKVNGTSGHKLTEEEYKKERKKAVAWSKRVFEDKHKSIFEFRGEAYNILRGFVDIYYCQIYKNCRICLQSWNIWNEIKSSFRFSGENSNSATFSEESFSKCVEGIFSGFVFSRIIESLITNNEYSEENIFSWIMSGSMFETLFREHVANLGYFKSDIKNELEGKSNGSKPKQINNSYLFNSDQELYFAKSELGLPQYSANTNETKVSISIDELTTTERQAETLLAPNRYKYFKNKLSICLEKLNPRQALILNEIFVKGVPQTDIAEVLDKARSQINRDYITAKNRLLTCLSKGENVTNSGDLNDN
jgi:hypothetical protein